MWLRCLRFIRRLLASALLVAVPLLLVTTPVDAKSGEACTPRHSYTLTANRQVRVYALVVRGSGRYVWACSRESGRRFYLGAFDPHDPDYSDHVQVRLRGRLVGSLASYHDHYGEGDFRVVVRDARTGEVLHLAQKKGSSEYDVAWDPVRFVMDRGGSVAWTTVATGPDINYAVYLFKCDKERWGETLDSGPDLDAQSLRRQGKTLTWTNAGTMRSAQLRR